MLSFFPVEARRDVAAGLHVIEQFVDARVSFHAESQQTALAETIHLVREVAATQAAAHAAQLAAQTSLASRLDRQDLLVDLLTRLVVAREAADVPVTPGARTTVPDTRPAAPAPPGDLSASINAAGFFPA